MKKLLFSILFFCCVHSSYAQWNTDRMLTIGKNAVYYEDYVLAIQYFNQLIKIKPYLPEPYMQRAIAKISLGDYVGAEKDCDVAIEINPFVPQAYHVRGFARKKLGKYEEATNDFEKALKFSPDNEIIIVNLIEAKEKKQDYKAAIESIKHYQKIKPNSKGLDFEIGRMYLLEKDTLSAMASFERAIQKDSTDVLGYIGRATLKAQQNDMQGAIEDFQLLKSKNPKAKGINFELGRVYLMNKDTVNALKYFGKAIAEDNKNIAAYSARGLIRMQMKDEKGALADYNEAIKRNSDFVGDYINRGVLNAKANKYNLALHDYDRAIELDPANSLTYLNRGLLRENLGDKNNALSDYNKVLQLTPNNYEVRFQQAKLELELGMLDKAVANYKIILERYPFFIPAYYGIANAKDKMGKKSESKHYLNLASEVLNNKDYYRKKQEIYAKNLVDIKLPEQTQENLEKKALIDKLTITDKSGEYVSEYEESNIRGTIQNKMVDIKPEDNFILTYYPTENELRRTNTYHPILATFNAKNNYYKELKITTREEPLTAELLNSHFESINLLSKQIEKNPQDEIVYLDRAIDFTLTKDYESALESLNEAIEINPNLTLALFLRANIYCFRQKESNLIINQRDNENIELKQITLGSATKQHNYDAILEDLNRVIVLAPDFSFAYYNKANILLEQKNYEKAIDLYTKAIHIDTEFAEAYFNRGIAYLMMNDEKNAINDLSKAGELGVYQSYNILKRLMK